MTAASVILVSDSHLSQAAPEAQANWDAVVGYISAASPEAAAGPELATSPPYRFWPPPARHRLGNLLKDKPTALIVSGHVHQYRLLRLEGTDHVWAPTTWAVLPMRCNRCWEPSGAGSCHSCSPQAHQPSRGLSSPPGSRS